MALPFHCIFHFLIRNVLAVVCQKKKFKKEEKIMAATTKNPKLLYLQCLKVYVNNVPEKLTNLSHNGYLHILPPMVLLDIFTEVNYHVFSYGFFQKVYLFFDYIFRIICLPSSIMCFLLICHESLKYLFENMGFVLRRLSAPCFFSVFAVELIFFFIILVLYIVCDCDSLLHTYPDD